MGPGPRRGVVRRLAGRRCHGGEAPGGCGDGDDDLDVAVADEAGDGRRAADGAQEPDGPLVVGLDGGGDDGGTPARPASAASAANSARPTPRRNQASSTRKAASTRAVAAPGQGGRAADRAVRRDGATHERWAVVRVRRCGRARGARGGRRPRGSGGSRVSGLHRSTRAWSAARSSRAAPGRTVGQGSSRHEANVTRPVVIVNRPVVILLGCGRGIRHTRPPRPLDQPPAPHAGLRRDRPQPDHGRGRRAQGLDVLPLPRRQGPSWPPPPSTGSPSGRRPGMRPLPRRARHGRRRRRRHLRRLRRATSSAPGSARGAPWPPSRSTPRRPPTALADGHRARPCTVGRPCWPRRSRPRAGRPPRPTASPRSSSPPSRARSSWPRASSRASRSPPPTRDHARDPLH